MQKNLHFLMGVLLATACIASCTERSSSNAFSSKQDSVTFARAVYQLYSDDVTQVKLDTNWLPGNDGVHPITWDTVQAYQDFYDKEPGLFNLQKQPYKGFSVDANGYAWITRNKAIQGLYLRLGRKGDGSYTIMLLGTDSSGKILQKNSLRTATGTNGDPSNFDNSIPCPDDCPVDPD